MQKVVGFFSKPENLFVLTLLIGLFTGTYKVVSKASNHNNSLYQRVSSPICFYLRLFGYVYTLPWIGSLLISGGNYEEWLQASKNTEPYRFFIIGLVMIRLQSLGENYEPEALHLRILRIKADRLLGKTKVIEQPTMQKRKMRLRETVRRKSKAHGIRALYYKWLYYLGVFKRRPKVYGSAFTTARWQLNAYIKQFDYVAKYNLKTRDDVEQRLRVVQHEISGQIDEREEIRAVLRCLETGDAEIQEQLEKIEKINAQLKKLRSEAKLCVQILEQQPQIKSKIDKAHEVKTFETERGKENGRASDYHLEHRRNEAAPTREQRSSGSARSSDSIQRR